MIALIEGVIIFGIGTLFGGWCVYVKNKGENPVTIIITMIGKLFGVIKRTFKYSIKTEKKEEEKV